jgi:ribonuclease J
MDHLYQKDDSHETQTKLKPLATRRGHKFRLIPLGGLGEIGMNMMVFEYGNVMFAVDCGMTFPDEELLGVDFVIPDITYILEHRENFKGIVLTHAHEDHVGALPYLLQQLNVPVYGTALTCAMVKERLKEWDLADSTDFNVVEPKETIHIGDVPIQFIQVTHSIPDAVAVAIKLPYGTIIHTGDYKIDNSPMDGKMFDFGTFAQLGDEGVLALLSDSTNVERDGYSKSERDVIEPIDKLFAAAPRSIIFSCFSSSLHRVQVVLDLAARHKKKVFVSGLNMIRNLRIAAEVGAIYYPPDLVFEVRDIKKAPPEKRVILTTGSQGEPMSGLSRMSLDEHKDVKIKPGDMVILSSRIIPGNEKSIYRMINHFFRRGAEVFYQDIAGVHVSGHAYREEMRQMIALCRPKYMIPLHGEFRHLVEHKHLAVEMGIDPEKVFILQNGDVIEMDADGAARGGKIEVSRVLVDGRDVGSIDEVVLRDRRHLAEDGMVIVMLVIEKSNVQLVAGPDIVSRGFLYMDENELFFERCKQVVLDAFEDCEKESKEEWAVVKAEVRRALKKFIKTETGRFPVILPVVLEI